MTTVTLYVSAPPATQYQRGATLAVEGESIAAVTSALDGYLGENQVGELLVKSIVGSNLAKAVLDVTPKAVASAPDGVVTVQEEANAAAAAYDGDHPTDSLAKAAAKKSGKSVDEVKALTTAEAKALLKGGK